MTYVYNKYKHYESQVDDIRDLILLDQVQQPNFIEHAGLKQRLSALVR